MNNPTHLKPDKFSSSIGHWIKEKVFTFSISFASSKLNLWHITISQSKQEMTAILNFSLDHNPSFPSHHWQTTMTKTDYWCQPCFLLRAVVLCDYNSAPYGEDMARCHEKCEWLFTFLSVSLFAGTIVFWNWTSPKSDNPMTNTHPSWLYMSAMFSVESRKSCFMWTQFSFLWRTHGKMWWKMWMTLHFICQSLSLSVQLQYISPFWLLRWSIISTDDCIC